jgi:hypothetical protein
MKRLAVALALTLPMMMLAAPSALAAKPTYERVPVDATFIEESCGVPVEFHIVGVSVTIQWVDADGTTRAITAFPQGRLTLTNLDTGTSITLNVSGPGHTTEGADGSFTMVGTGLWEWGINPETGEPGEALTSGRWVFSIDTAGNGSFQIVGRVTDLCPQLTA